MEDENAKILENKYHQLKRKLKKEKDLNATKSKELEELKIGFEEMTMTAKSQIRHNSDSEGIRREFEVMAA